MGRGVAKPLAPRAKLISAAFILSSIPEKTQVQSNPFYLALKTCTWQPEMLFYCEVGV